MAKIAITFDDEEPYGGAAARRAMNATNAYLALWDIDGWLRNKIKYDNREELQEVRDALHEFLDDHSIDLDDLE